MYDIFYVSKNEGNDEDWKKIKEKYPLAQRLKCISSFDEIKSKSFTKMFWVIWDDLDLNNTFNLLEYTTTKWDDMYVHIFKNGEHYDGICLFPKVLSISNREFYHRFFSQKKEIDIVASLPKNYNIYSPYTYNEYLEIKDEMFWIVWPETQIINQSIFDLYFSHHNSYDRRENHIFRNLCNDSISYISGTMLCSKYKPLSKKEFEKQYAVDKKEHDIVVSRYRYPVYHISSYSQYQQIVKLEKQKMFWGVWPEIEIADETVFDFYFEPNNKLYDYDRTENHMFAHTFNGKITYVNGVVLFSKEKPISHREFTHRFLIEKKEHDIVASHHRLYDVVFISYNESNANENYAKLLEVCPRAKRVHGIKGIHQAHIQAARSCHTDMFWVIDGDAIVNSDFNFDLVMSSYDTDCVHVWRSQNPINGLEYGNGGVKLLPRQLTCDMNVNTADMTTSIAKKFKAMDEVSNINSFNTDAFATWRSAFRECCKLASKTINRQNDQETADRLNAWLTFYPDKMFAQEAVDGAIAGKEYGKNNTGNLEALSKINNFEWLEEQYRGRY